MIPDALFEETEQFAKKAYKEFKKLTPMFIFLFGNKRKVIQVDFKDNFNKEIAIRALRLLVAEEKPLGYFFVTEAWLHIVKQDDDITIRPSDSPDKKSVIVVSYFGNDMSVKTNIYQINTKDDKVTFNRLRTSKSPQVDAYSRFNFYLEDVPITYDDMKKRFDKAREDAKKIKK